GIHTIFDGTRCILCGGCVDVCPESCLRMVPLSRVKGDDPVVLLANLVTGPALSASAGRALGAEPTATVMIMDPTRCIRCALCAIRCPTGAISMEAFRYADTWTPI
ncbi:MAG TPA: 4Fe-4S binding protein, partial [Candidatus Methylomirabilis sp.]|nr:4Fe-4S binding protein [Candidatus Methylomirabilis sp.]